MVFIPPIGRPASAAAEGIAEEAGFKVGDILEGRVVRKVGDRYLFMDMGKQLKLKIHWELPFEVKPGEILNFEVVSDDPLTFKLVDDESRAPSGGVDRGQPVDEPAAGRVEISTVDISANGKDEPLPRVTYGPVKERVATDAEHDEPVRTMPLPEPGEETVAPREAAGEVEPPGSHGEESLSLTKVFEDAGVEIRSLEDLSSLLSNKGVSDAVLSLLSEEPFFSLYEEERPDGDLLDLSKTDLLKNLVSKGMNREQLGQLKALFQDLALPRVADLLKVVEEAILNGTQEMPADSPAEGSPGDIVQEQLQAEGENAVSVPQPQETGLPVQDTMVSLSPQAAEAGFEPVPVSIPDLPHGEILPVQRDAGASQNQTALAEPGGLEVPLGEGGERLAIRIWPATSRFTIDSTTPPPPGLKLDVGDMLQGRIAEVEGNKVIIDFGSFETQATWNAANTVKPGATIKVMVASLLPQLQLRLVDDAPFRGFMAKLGSIKGWGQLFSKLQGAMEHLPLVHADKGEGVLLRTLKSFMANNGLSTEARMAQVAGGELPPEELNNDLKLQLARLIATGTEPSQVEAAKELMQSVGGHQLLNVQTQNSGFFIIPLVVAYHQRIDEWRMTVAEDEAEGERWFRLTLLSSPPDIGTIRIDLSYAERSRRLDMLFWVEREKSKALLDKALPLLKEEFTESKVNLTRVEVGVSKHLSQEDLPIEIKRPYLLQMKA